MFCDSQTCYAQCVYRKVAYIFVSVDKEERKVGREPEKELEEQVFMDYARP